MSHSANDNCGNPRRACCWTRRNTLSFLALFIASWVAAQDANNHRPSVKPGGAERQVFGVTPGQTSDEELSSLKAWGTPYKEMIDPAGDRYLIYDRERFRVAATLRDGVVQSLDIKFPESPRLEVVEEHFQLGQKSDDSLPEAAHVGLQVPSRLGTLHYPNRNAVAFHTSDNASQVELLRFYARAVASECSSSQASIDFCRAGITSLEAGDIDSAVENCTESIRQDPQHACPYHYRAEALYRRGDLPNALKDSEQVVTLRGDANAYANFAFLQNEANRFSDAISSANKAIELEPESAFGYLQRGIGYAKSSQLENAKLDFDRGIQLAPDNPQLFYNRAQYFTERGSYRAALADATRAVELAPDDAQAHGIRAFCHGTLGEYRLAIRELSEAIRLAPSNPYFYKLRAEAYERLHDFPRAEADWQEARRLKGSR